MFNYKKMCFTIIYSIFFSYSTNKIESPCANPRYTQCLKSFSYLLTAVVIFFETCSPPLQPKSPQSPSSSH